MYFLAILQKKIRKRCERENQDDNTQKLDENKERNGQDEEEKERNGQDEEEKAFAVIFSLRNQVCGLIRALRVFQVLLLRCLLIHILTMQIEYLHLE